MMRLDVELFLQKLEPSQKRGLAADLSGAIYVTDVPERFWYKTANDEAINKWLTEVLNQEALPEYAWVEDFIQQIVWGADSSKQ
jgi:hypothetical protein